MKLRDNFSGDLDKLVNYFDIDKETLETKLNKAGYDFLPEAGQFR